MRRIALIALVLGTTLPASAQDAADRGRLHFQAGASYYEAGDYEDALREFQRAYELSEKPELFYNLSLCHQQLGDLDQAASFLEQYLQNVEDIPNRTNLERRLENFQRRIAQAQSETQTDTQTDTHTDAQDPAPTQEGGGANVPAIIGFGVAGAGALMLGISGGLAMAKRSELDDEGCSPNCDSSDVSSLRRRAVFADVGLGLAVVGAALGVVFLFVGGDDDDAEARQVRVEPYAGAHGAGAMLSGQF